MKKSAPQSIKGPFSFLFLISKPYKVAAFVAFSAVVLATTIVSFSPYVYKRIVDSLGGVNGIGPESVWFWALMYVGTHLLSSLLWRTSGFSGLRWATGVRKTGREMLTSHIVGHSHSYFSNRFAGSLSSKLNQASEGVKSMVEGILWQWTEFFLQFGISLYLAFITSAQIGWVFVIWVAIMTPINIVVFKKKMVLGKAGVRADTELTAHTVDMLTNISAVRDYARIPFELDRAYKFIEERRRAGAANWRFTEKAVTLNNIFEAIFSGGMILATVYFWELGRITAGDILLVITLVASMRKTISTIGKEFNSFADTLSLVKEGLSEVLNEHEIVDVPGAKNLEVKEGLIKFENVSFHYDKREIFKDLNLEIKPGQRIGLIGRSGAGKSTLVKLLTRQHELSQGRILIDGQDIAKVKQESLREAIAGVPQEPLLFHRSLKENISYGNLKVGDKEIILAAERAQASQFIEVLPAKYETLVGERGIKLSGGEKQRVAIARAFLKDAKILLLDEATSALDSESEIFIQEALKKLMEGKTVIAIAHRLSTLRAMDRLVIMDNGRIVEDGTHEELLEKGGIYAGLWAHQAGGFLQEE